MLKQEYDEVSIKTNFMTMILSKFIIHTIKKKVGKNMDLKIDKLYLKSSPDDSEVMFNLNLRGKIAKNDLNDLVNGYLEGKGEK